MKDSPLWTEEGTCKWMVTGPRSVLQLGYTESWVSVLRRGDSFRLGIREDFREEVAFGLSPGG